MIILVTMVGTMMITMTRMSDQWDDRVINKKPVEGPPRVRVMDAGGALSMSWSAGGAVVGSSVGYRKTISESGPKRYSRTDDQ